MLKVPIMESYTKFLCQIVILQRSLLEKLKFQNKNKMAFPTTPVF